VTIKHCKLVLIILVWSTICVGQMARGEPPVSREYALKAAFLYNFAQFVEWPKEAFPDESTPIVFCIVGEDPFGIALEPMKGRAIRGRKTVIKRGVKPDELTKCHICFVSRSEGKNLAKILAELRDWDGLTVSDMEGFAQRGGVIGLVTVEDGIHLEINVDAAERAGLTVSSRLLKLAKIIGGDAGRKGN
jgi:hypothetical protein